MVLHFLVTNLIGIMSSIRNRLTIFRSWLNIENFGLKNYKHNCFVFLPQNFKKPAGGITIFISK